MFIHHIIQRFFVNIRKNHINAVEVTNLITKFKSTGSKPNEISFECLFAMKKSFLKIHERLETVVVQFI